jgi:hypothetical protein
MSQAIPKIDLAKVFDRLNGPEQARAHVFSRKAPWAEGPEEEAQLRVHCLNLILADSLRALGFPPFSLKNK